MDTVKIDIRDEIKNGLFSENDFLYIARNFLPSLILRTKKNKNFEKLWNVNISVAFLGTKPGRLLVESS